MGFYQKKSEGTLERKDVRRKKLAERRAETWESESTQCYSTRISFSRGFGDPTELTDEKEKKGKKKVGGLRERSKNVRSSGARTETMVDHARSSQI